MSVDFVIDCLFDLMNESDLLDVKDVKAHKNQLYLILFDNSRFLVEVKPLGKESAETENNG